MFSEGKDQTESIVDCESESLRLICNGKTISTGGSEDTKGIASSPYYIAPQFDGFFELMFEKCNDMRRSAYLVSARHQARGRCDGRPH